MSWLTAHMWMELLLAAICGGLIGWSFRYFWRGRDDALRESANPPTGAPTGGDSKIRMVELESQLRAEREEVSALRLRINESGRARPVSEAAEIEGDEDTLEWRNRYLESRVRFLEKQLADLSDGPEPAAPENEEATDEATRLVWRNRYLEGRVRYLEDELVKGGSLEATSVAKAPTTKAQKTPEGEKPQTLSEARNGKPDNLKQIAGVGPKLEKVLNGLGIYHLDQIAQWTEREIAWVNAAISFKGRIEREKWVDQARALTSRLQA